MPTKKLKSFLDKNGVKYLTLSHSKAYTAQEVASTTHISGNSMAKTVMIKVDGNMAMAVLPASYQVVFDNLRLIFETTNVKLASESEFMDRFPDCEIGAMPPFGNLYKMEVFVAESLTKDKLISFNAGTHTELIRMNYDDYKRLVKPRVFKFSEKIVSLPADPKERWDEEYMNF